LRDGVDKIAKLLKTKAFILQKFLDTAFRCPIRFRQKVLMVFLELRWNYSPLKEKAVQLPDGLFVSSGRFAANRSRIMLIMDCSAPDARCSARKPASPRSIFVASLHAATVYRSKNESFLLPVQRPRRVVGSPLFVFPSATVYGTRECFCS
jgi:hypothetical protein